MTHRLGQGALVLLVVVNIVLFLAVRQHMDVSAASPSVETSAPAASPSAQDEVADPAAAGAQGLELSPSGLLARVSRGRCTASTRPLIEISADQGSTFDEIALPLLEDVDTSTVGPKAATVRTIIQVRAKSADEITVIGSNKQCQPRRFVTKDGGSSWKQSKPKKGPDSAEGWYVDAAGTGVVSPNGATEPGCDVVAIAPVTDRNAKVACEDGTIGGTNDFGAVWVVLGELDNVAGLTFDSLNEGFAVSPDTDCDARLMRTGDAGGRWEPVGCISKKNSASALVGSATLLYALVDGKVKVSEDSGETWAAPKKPAAA